MDIGDSFNNALLFAKIKLPKVIIKLATLPDISDVRRKNYYQPNQIHQQAIINKLFLKNLHYVGEWHTHPEKYPSPSLLDINSMKDCFKRSRHELNYFVMIIIGNSFNENMLWVGIHNSETYFKL